jgi:heme/copper-type cytochrome/quinol oxidase subunit 1
MRKFKVENILLVFICLFICVMILIPSTIRPLSIDIHIHDTYYIIGGLHFSLFLLVYCFFLFALYKRLRRRTGDIKMAVALPHIFLTIFVIVVFLVSEYFVIYSRPGPMNIDDYEYRMSFRFILTSLFIVAQVGFFFYFFVEWLRTRRKV